MRQKSMPVREPAERVVKDIRRATRRHFLAEDKIRVVLDGLRGEVSTPEQMYGPPPVGKHFRSMAGRGLLQCIRPFGGAICSWPRWVFTRLPTLADPTEALLAPGPALPSRAA